MAADPFFSALPDSDDVIESPAKPMKIALGISLCFFCAGVGYILLSSHIAAIAAATVPDLASIEKIKGLLFIACTTLLLFFVVFGLMRRIDRQQRRLLNFGNRLIAAERRATAAVLADSVSHDIGNVLMSLEYYTNEMVEARDAEKKTAMEKIGDSLSRLNSLARRMGKISGHLANEAREYLNLPHALQDALDFASRHRSLRSCRLDVEAPEELMFMGNLLLIYQMVINLVLNAAEATRYRGHIRVRLLVENDFAVIEVHDNGPGVEQSRRETIMEPFYTTKENGAGLGLLSVMACARAHRGKVEIRDSELGGACFSVRLKKTPAVIDDAGV